jgi:hypothetical protein
LLAVLFAFGGTLSAAIPDVARNDPRFPLGYLVVTHYAGVHGDGTGDATAGLQQAIDDAYANDLVAFLPLGTYVISDTLRLFQWRPLNSDGSQATNPYRQKAFQLGGEHGVGGARPLLRLAPRPRLRGSLRIRPGPGRWCCFGISKQPFTPTRPEPCRPT